jgi:hypothetical protein
VRSAMVGTLIGADEAEVARRQAALLAALGQTDESESAWFEARQARWILGTPADARAMVGRFADAGVERLMLQDFLPWDLEMIDLMGAEIVARS